MRLPAGSATPASGIHAGWVPTGAVAVLMPVIVALAIAVALTPGWRTRAP
jgi:hypothetical protein